MGNRMFSKGLRLPERKLSQEEAMDILWNAKADDPDALPPLRQALAQYPGLKVNADVALQAEAS